MADFDWYNATLKDHEDRIRKEMEAKRWVHPTVTEAVSGETQLSARDEMVLHAQQNIMGRLPKDYLPSEWQKAKTDIADETARIDAELNQMANSRYPEQPTPEDHARVRAETEATFYKIHGKVNYDDGNIQRQISS